MSLRLSAHADQVRWRQVGSVRVRAWSEPSGAVVEENLTTGLPRPIPGQRSFRDVGWTLRGEASFAAPAGSEATPIPPTVPPPPAPQEEDPR